MRATSPSDGVSAGRASADGDDRMQAESADRNVDRRQRAEHADPVDVQRHFLVRLAQRRLLERFAGIDDAARQRHLAAVPAERIGANGQDDVRAVVVRKQEQQSGGVTDARGIETGRPISSRDRREALVRARRRAGQRKTIFEQGDDVGE